MGMVEDVLKEFADTMRFMKIHPDGGYWYGQLTAGLDSAGADIHTFLTTSEIVPFDPDK